MNKETFMKKHWIVCIGIYLIPSFIKKVVSYDKKIFKPTIIYSEAHKYSSEDNAMKAALAFNGKVEIANENQES